MYLEASTGPTVTISSTDASATTFEADVNSISTSGFANYSDPIQSVQSYRSVRSSERPSTCGGSWTAAAVTEHFTTDCSWALFARLVAQNTGDRFVYSGFFPKLDATGEWTGERTLGFDVVLEYVQSSICPPQQGTTCWTMDGQPISNSSSPILDFYLINGIDHTYTSYGIPSSAFPGPWLWEIAYTGATTATESRELHLAEVTSQISATPDVLDESVQAVDIQAQFAVTPPSWASRVTPRIEVGSSHGTLTSFDTFFVSDWNLQWNPRDLYGRFAAYGDYHITAAPQFGSVRQVGGTYKSLQIPAPSDHYRQSRFSPVEGLGVNPLAGNFSVSSRDLFIPGNGDSSLEVTRTYSSTGEADSDLIMGPGWSWSYGKRLTFPADGQAVVNQPNGRRDYYSAWNDGTYHASRDVYDQLRTNGDGTYSLITVDHVTETYGSDGRLVSIRDRSGNQVTLAYDVNGRPSAVTDDSGRTLTLGYSESGRLTSIQDPAGRTVRYEYDDLGRLFRVWNLADNPTEFFYDGDRITRVYNAWDQRLVYNEYDSAGRVNLQKDAFGNTWTYSYDPANRTSTVSDPRGATITYQYDVQQRVLNRQDPAGSTVMSYRLDELSSIQDRRGYIQRYYYNNRGQVTSVYDPGGVHRLWYENGNLIRYQDPRWTGADILSRGNLDVLYDSYNRPYRITTRPTFDKTGYSSTLGYDAKGNLSYRSNARSYTTTYSHDAHGNVTAVQPTGSAPYTMNYNLVGQRLTITDPRGNETGAVPGSYTTAYTYSPLGQLRTLTNAQNKVTQFEYDTRGNLERIIDPLQRIELFAHDPYHRTTSTTRYLLDPNTGAATSDTSTWEYDANGNVTKSTDPRGNSEAYLYDLANRLEQSIDPYGQAEIYAYDSEGNLTQRTDRNGNLTSFTYNWAGNLLTQTQSAYSGAQVLMVRHAYTYDKVGNRTAYTDPRGYSTRYEYDLLNQLTRVTDPQNQATEYSYDANGNRIRIKDPKNQLTTLVYDAQDRLVTEYAPLQTHEYTYDSVGNPVKRRKPDGSLILQTFNELNQLIRMDYPDFTFVEYEYDDAGRRLTSRDQAGRLTTFTYDSLDRLIASQDGFGRTVSYAFDLADNRTQIAYPNGNQTAYTYDSANRLKTYTDVNGTPVTLDYDLGGRLLQESWGVASTPLSFRVSYEYNEANWLTKVYSVRTDNKEKTLRSFAYVYDAAGNRISQSETLTKCELGRKLCTSSGSGSVTVSDSSSGSTTTDGFDEPALDGSDETTTDGGGTGELGDTLTGVSTGGGGGSKATRYTYDQLNRLTRVDYPDRTWFAYTYDAVGNRTTQASKAGTRTYTYNEANQLTWYTIDEGSALETRTLEYDANGNLLRHGATYYGYDQEDRLVKVTHPNGTFTYAYDADGVRLSETGPNGTRQFTADRAISPYRDLMEYSPAGQVINVLSYGRDLFSQNSAANGTSYVHQDGLDSTSTLTASDGTVQAQYAYEAFGRFREGSSGNWHLTTRKFTGEDYNLTTQLIFLRARFYDPALGRFLSQDTYKGSVRQPWTQNLYTYVGNNPVNYTDPTGHSPCRAMDEGHIGRFGECGAGNAAAALAMNNGLAVALSMAEAGAKVSSYADTVAGEIGNSVTYGAPKTGYNANGAHSETPVTPQKATSMEEIINDPSKLQYMTPDEVAALAQKEGLQIRVNQKGTNAGKGFRFNTGTDGQTVQFHPGSGHHGPSPYWKVSSGKLGTVRIPLDPRNFDPGGNWWSGPTPTK